MTRVADRRVDLTYDDNRLLSVLCGEHDRHLARIESQTGVSIITRGNLLTVAGAPEALDIVVAVLDALWDRLKQGLPVGVAEVDAALRIAGTGTPDRDVGAGLGVGTAPGPSALAVLRAPDAGLKAPRRTVTPRSAGQIAYLAAMRRHELVFGIGPAGTGKTYLAVAQAVALLVAGSVRRIILSRPAVEAGERLGFLPGDLREKVDPYLRPLYDALYDMIPSDQVLRRLTAGEIEIAPLAFMRGRTLSDAFVILDEAQNTTPMQMKMFLTRLGEGGRMVVTGDLTQIDLGPGQRSGLADAVAILEGVEGIGLVRFTGTDVVRHPLVARIVHAYEAHDRARWADGGPVGARTS